MRLVLMLAGGAVEINPTHDEHKQHPYLLAVGTLRQAARAGRLAGLGVGESPSLDVLLQNNARQVSRLIGTPLRAQALVLDGDSTFFDGIVSRVVLGKTMTLILES